MSNSHTPGPWRAHSFNNDTVQANDDWTVYGPDGQSICMEGNGLPEDGANARLIAAAPELLEALMGLRSLIQRDAPQLSGKALGYADAAIAKATGSTHD